MIISVQSAKSTDDQRMYSVEMSKYFISTKTRTTPIDMTNGVKQGYKRIPRDTQRIIPLRYPNKCQTSRQPVKLQPKILSMCIDGN